jgi:ectoine hydroxylase-related dioxygenase (phytanoyl-CoA dioxygenase family)
MITKKNPFFINQKNQLFFDSNGYIKIEDCSLNQHEIDELNTCFNKSGFNKYTENAVYIAMDDVDKIALKNAHQIIKNILTPKLETFLINPLIFFSTYIIKYPNSKVSVLPHQDGTFVEDESKVYSITCWIPLVDVDMHNGCMGVIKRSNNIYKSIRPLPSPQVTRPLDKHSFILVPYFELIPMKAGEFLLFDNKTFHNSPPNLNNIPRVAISCWITQKDASFRIYYLKPGTKNILLKYEIDDKFYFKYDNTILSKMYDEGKLIDDYPLLSEEKYIYDNFSKNKMIKKVKEAGNSRNVAFEQYMKKYFPNEMKESILSKIKNLFY